MPTVPTLPLLLAAAALAAPFVAAAHEFQAGPIVISYPWTRPTAGAVMPGVGYMILDNRGPDDDRLVSASSPAATSVTMHRTQVRDGIASMRPQADSIVVPAGGAVRLEPGGYHLMLEGLGRPFALGEMIPLSLTFAGAGTVRVELKVERRRAAGGDHGSHQAPAD